MHPHHQDQLAMQGLVDRLTQPVDVVLDPFVGSGTTLLAALACNRKAIGSDPVIRARSPSPLDGSAMSESTFNEAVS